MKFQALTHRYISYDGRRYLLMAKFPQDPWVSPIHYDPASGLYVQTFQPEDEEFLEKYGQRIVPEYPELQHSSYYEEELSEVSISSFVNDDSQATSMLQYTTLSPFTVAQPVEHGIPQSAMGSGNTLHVSIPFCGLGLNN